MLRKWDLPSMTARPVWLFVLLLLQLQCSLAVHGRRPKLIASIKKKTICEASGLSYQCGRRYLHLEHLRSYVWLQYRRRWQPWPYSTVPANKLVPLLDNPTHQTRPEFLSLLTACVA
ncbi:hypothetical protein BC834DRAFT_388529 [Gloeopeniophorella convolvens]|nr:hypothetical protein BC834DRAFT_388529 [Gloeopeniophorella convolvens]